LFLSATATAPQLSFFLSKESDFFYLFGFGRRVQLEEEQNKYNHNEGEARESQDSS
jgi:hypothetical protein